MDVHVPELVDFSGGPTKDGFGVAAIGKTDDGQSVFFCVERTRVSWIIASLAQWTQKAAKKAGWKAQPIAGQDDTGIWMRPTQYGLIDTDTH